MSNFGALTDHFSIATTDLILIESSLSPDVESVATALDENGDLAARQEYGNDGGAIKTANCTYLLKSGTLDLATLSVGELEEGVAVESISVATSNGDWPRVTVVGKLGMDEFQAPTGKTAAAALPTLTITGGKFAQPLSFTVGAGCKLNSCSFSAAAEIARADDGLGEPAAFGASFNAPPEITAEFVRITTQPSWTVSGALTQTQAPTTVQPQAAYHTSTAAGVLAALVRGTPPPPEG